MKICPVGGQTDGQTDVTKLIAAFRNFANASKSDGLLSSEPTQYNNNQIVCNDQSCKIHEIYIHC